jgi:hypothetical protein
MSSAFRHPRLGSPSDQSVPSPRRQARARWPRRVRPNCVGGAHLAVATDANEAGRHARGWPRQGADPVRSPVCFRRTGIGATRQATCTHLRFSTRRRCFSLGHNERRERGWAPDAERVLVSRVRSRPEASGHPRPRERRDARRRGRVMTRSATPSPRPGAAAARRWSGRRPSVRYGTRSCACRRVVSGDHVPPRYRVPYRPRPASVQGCM